MFLAVAVTGLARWISAVMAAISSSFPRGISRTSRMREVMMGFGMPDCGVHGPNEFFDLGQFHGGIETVIHYCHYLAGP